MAESKLDSKVFLITGATSGMGRETARLFRSQGAKLVLGGRDRARGESLCAELDPTGENVTLLCGDVAEESVNKQLVSLAMDRYGRLDGLVSSAGALGLGSITDVPVDTWKQTFDVNVTAVFYLLRHAIPRLKEAGSASVIINASIAATKCFPNHPAYCASKAAVVALGRQAARDYSPEVRVNSICPGPVDTPLIWDSAKAFPDPATAVQAAGEATLMRRLGLPEDFARLALFLASDDASWITGAAYTLDGGATVQS